MGYEYRRVQFLSFPGGLSPIGQFFFDGHYTAGSGSAGQPLVWTEVSTPGTRSRHFFKSAKPA